MFKGLYLQRLSEQILNNKFYDYLTFLSILSNSVVMCLFGLYSDEMIKKILNIIWMFFFIEISLKFISLGVNSNTLINFSVKNY